MGNGRFLYLDKVERLGWRSTQRSIQEQLVIEKIQTKIINETVKQIDKTVNNNHHPFIFLFPYWILAACLQHSLSNSHSHSSKG